jgi:hypothetical protein
MLVPETIRAKFQLEVTVEKRSLSDGRKFSLKAPVREVMLEGSSMAVHGLYFEGGQQLTLPPGEASYQILEGDAAFTGPHGTERARKGNIVVGEVNLIENLGGGLLVILETRAK